MTASTTIGGCVQPSRAHVDAAVTSHADIRRRLVWVRHLSFVLGARERVGEEHERQRKKPTPPESSLLGKSENAHQATQRLLRVRNFSKDSSESENAANECRTHKLCSGSGYTGMYMAAPPYLISSDHTTLNTAIPIRTLNLSSVGRD